MTPFPRLTALYVPGSRPDRFGRAISSGAQVVILDLEDAVAPGAKAAARDTVENWFAGWTGDRSTDSPVLQVRVNARASEWFDEDLGMVARLARLGPVELRLPKAQSEHDIIGVTRALGGEVPVCALVETALGLENAFRIAGAPGIGSVGLGESDLAGQLGSSSPAVLDWARIRLLVAARAAGLPAPMMSVYPDLRDLDGLVVDTRRGASLGLVGRAAVHPAQLLPIARAFRPSPDRLGWADQVEEALLAAGGGVAVLASGEMVDAAMSDQAAGIRSLESAVAGMLRNTGGDVP